MAANAGLHLALCDSRGCSRLSPDLVRELSRALAAPPRHAWVALEGGPAAFCEGMDLALLSEPKAGAAIEAWLHDFAGLLRAIESHPRPVVALVDGAAQGGGVGIAAAADLVLASERASFALPEALVGLIPAVVLPVLARRVAPTHARSLALGRTAWSAETALRRGLVDEVGDDLQALLRRHTTRLARMSPRALAAVKELCATSFASPEAYTEAAARRFAELLASPATRARLRRMQDGEAPWPSTPEDVAEERE